MKLLLLDQSETVDPPLVAITSFETLSLYSYVPIRTAGFLAASMSSGSVN